MIAAARSEPPESDFGQRGSGANNLPPGPFIFSWATAFRERGRSLLNILRGLAAPLAKIAIFGHPPPNFSPPSSPFNSILGRVVRACIASLFSLFSFAIFLDSTKRIFPDFRRTLSTGFDCWLCYFGKIIDPRAAVRHLRGAEDNTISTLLAHKKYAAKLPDNQCVAEPQPG